MYLLNICLHVSYSSKYGTTALMHAAYGNRLKCLNALLAAGADLTLQDNVSIVIFHRLSYLTLSNIHYKYHYTNRSTNKLNCKVNSILIAATITTKMRR